MSYRYRDDDDRPFFLNAGHYIQAHQICRDAVSSADLRSGQPPTRVGDGRLLSGVGNPRIAEKNRLLPVDGHFSFYSDLLGFTMEVSKGGMDSLPDYYGGAVVAASGSPNVKVYLLSDTCVATASAENAGEFVEFISLVVSRWLSDGLIPQCLIGHGSFVERKPFPRLQLQNFLGTQISGTAISDAVGLLKRHKPLGSRILVSEAAYRHWPANTRELVGRDGQIREFWPERPLGEYVFDCLYYLLCLREHEPGTRPFDHYVWSFASRARAGGDAVRRLANTLAAPYCADGHHEAALHQIDHVVRLYETATSSSEFKCTSDQSAR